MVGIRVEYRTIAKGDKGPPVVCCADAKSAMRYVRGHAAELGVDPTRIAAAGGSAGGHLAAFTAIVASVAQADSLKVPPASRTRSCCSTPSSTMDPASGATACGGAVREFSPAHNITKAAPPTCVFLGDADKLIGVPVLREFEAAMKGAVPAADAHVYPGAAHSFSTRSRTSRRRSPWRTSSSRRLAG